MDKKRGIERTGGKDGSFAGGGMTLDDFINDASESETIALTENLINEKFEKLYDRLMKGLGGRPIPKLWLDVVFPNEKWANEWQNDYNYLLEKSHRWIAYQSILNSMNEINDFVKDTVDSAEKLINNLDSFYGNTIDGYDEIINSSLDDDLNIKLSYFPYDIDELKDELDDINENELKDLVDLIDYDNNQIESYLKMAKAHRKMKMTYDEITKVY